MGKNELMQTMAAYYASLGLRVVPLHGAYARLCTCNNPACRSPAKHPRTINGLKDGSSDAEVVTRMWTRWPFASIGICTGTDSGVLVIDLDDLQQVPDVLRSWALDEHPPTWRATTGRGGKHVFFRYDVDIAGIKSRTGVWPKVDVRADGGYVVAAPSPHINGNTYQWDIGCAPADTELASLPDEIEKALRAGGGTLVEQPAFVAGSPGGPDASYSRVGPLPGTRELRLHADDEARIRAALQFIDATKRDDWLHIGMALKSTGAGQQAFDIWTEWSQTKPHKFNEADQIATWRGLKELLPHGEEITIAKLFWMAKQRGAPDFTTVEVQLVEVPPQSTEQDAEPVENLPGANAEPVPTSAVEPLFEDFWPRLRNRSPLLAEIVDWITRTAPKKQPLLAFGNALAAIGALLGRRVRSPGNVRTNLYVFGIAGSGRGKEHSRQCVSQLFSKAGLGHWIGSDKWKSDSGVRTELLKAPAHLAQLDEFGKVLAQVASKYAPSHLAGIVTMLLELSGRAGGIDHGPAYADQKTRPREVITEPCLAVYATSVPADIFESLSSKSVADGFLNRWLCLFGDERPALAQSEEATFDPPDALVEAMRLLERNWRTEQTPPHGNLPQANMPTVAPASYVIPRSDDAAKRRREIGARIVQDGYAREDRGDQLADLWARVPELVEKVALTIAATRPVRIEWRDTIDQQTKKAVQIGVAVWDGKPAVPAGKDRNGFPVDAQVPATIEQADVDLAFDLVSWAFRRFEHEVAVRVADSEYEAKVKRVLRLLITAGTRGLKHNDLTRRAQWLSAREREDVMKTLVDSGQAIASVTMTTLGNGASKPLTVYRFAGFTREERNIRHHPSSIRQAAPVAASPVSDGA